MLAPQTILVATDFGETSITALAYGRALARAFGARLHILHVVEPISVDNATFGTFVSPVLDVEGELERAAREALRKIVTDDDRRELNVVVALRVLDTPAHAIVEYSRDQRIDLIVVGTHGRQGLSHVLMGSVAERVVRLAPCPVLSVRHAKHDFLAQDTIQSAPALAQ